MNRTMLFDSKNIVSSIDKLVASEGVTTAEALRRAATRSGRSHQALSVKYYQQRRLGSMAQVPHRDIRKENEEMSRLIYDKVEALHKTGMSKIKAFAQVSKELGKTYSNIASHYYRRNSLLLGNSVRKPILTAEQLALPPARLATVVKAEPSLPISVTRAMSLNYVKVLMIKHRISEDMAIAKTATDLNVSVEFLLKG